MAVPQNTLIGKTRQSVGGTTFSSWKGINVLKAKAVAVANPNTVAQQNQRARMKALVAMYQQSFPPIQEGMIEQAVKMSEFNAFTSINLKNGSVTATAGVATVVPASIEIARGSLNATNGVTLDATVGGTSVNITFDTSLTGSQLATDEAQLLWLSSTGEVKGYAANAGARSTSTSTVSAISSNVYAATDVVLFAMTQKASRKAEDTQVATA